MIALADSLRQSQAVYALLSVINAALVIAASTMLTRVFFRLPFRKNRIFPAACAVLTVLICAADPFITGIGSDIADLFWSAAGTLLPFAAMALLFQGKGLWKAMLTAAGYTFIEGLSFLLQLVLFGFDYENRNDALELIFSLFMNLVLFGAALLIFTKNAGKRAVLPGLTKTGAVLYLLAVLSTACFVATLLIVGPAFSAGGKRVEFAFVMLNIPLISATATFALVRYFKLRSESANMKRQLEMQISQFQRMEHMVEDVRVFRHDFPKKIRPLIAYLEGDHPEEAKQIAEQFSDFARNAGERFHTGNFRLDTVLYCEQQLASRDKIRIEVPFDAAFPAEGIEPDDIYTIFPNALDNAIEACRNVPEEQRTITLHTRMDRKTVFVTIRNPYSGEIRIKNGIPQTGKAEKTVHGYGYRSMKKAAGKYGNDNVSFSKENGIFELRLFLDYVK